MKTTSETKRWNDWDLSNAYNNGIKEGRAESLKEVEEIINKLRKGLTDPYYKYSNEFINDFMYKLKEEIKGERK